MLSVAPLTPIILGSPVPPPRLGLRPIEPPQIDDPLYGTGYDSLAPERRSLPEIEAAINGGIDRVRGRDLADVLGDVDPNIDYGSFDLEIRGLPTPGGVLQEHRQRGLFGKIENSLQGVGAVLADGFTALENL